MNDSEKNFKIKDFSAIFRIINKSKVFYMKASNSRRNFLKKSTTGLAGLFAFSKISASESVLSEPDSEQKIIYRVLGKTGIKLPVVSSGKLPINNENLAKAILNSEIIHVDNAYGYDNGKNEELLGKLLKEYPREKLVISSKLPGNFDDDGMPISEDKVIGMMENLNESLIRLGTDYVDILYLHGARTKEGVLYEPYLKMFKQIKEDGKAKFVGVSTHRNEAEVIRAAIESNLYDVVLTAVNFVKEDYVDIMNAIDEAGQAGLGVVAMKVFAGGFLDKEKTKPVNKSAALKWVLKNENVHTAILTIKSFSDLEEYIAMMDDLELNEQEIHDLEIQKEEAQLYCPGCNSCVEQCPYNLEIPEIMRAYMYAYGYSNLKDSKDLLKRINITNNTCENCDICLVNCPAGFEVQNKIKDIKRLIDVPNEFLT